MDLSSLVSAQAGARLCAALDRKARRGARARSSITAPPTQAHLFSSIIPRSLELVLVAAAVHRIDCSCLDSP